MPEPTEDLARHPPTRVETLIQKLLDPSLPIEQVSQQTDLLLASDDSLRVIRELPEGDRKKLVDKVDEAYAVVDPQNAKLLVAFGIICRAINLLPASVVIAAGLTKFDNVAIAPGGLTDTWRGKYHDTGVVIKAFRTYSTRNLNQAKKILWGSVPVWRKLSHPGIATFLGVDTGLFQLALVYGLDSENDNIVQYVRLHPQANRLSLLLQSAEALQYLHSLGIPHGNLSWTNVRVDASGRVRLTDYGLAAINTSSSFTAVSPTVGNTGWIAPEMIKPLDGQAPVETKPADIFAFGIVAVGAYTGELPFGGEESDTRVALRISGGERPKFPQDSDAVRFIPQIQALIEDSWCADPAERPTVGEVVTRLEALRENEYAQGTPNNQNYVEFVTDADVLSSGPQPTPPTPRQPVVSYRKENPRGHMEQRAQGSGTNTDGPLATPTAVPTPRSNASTSSSSKSSVPTPTEPSSRSDTTPGSRLSLSPGPTSSNGLGTRSTPKPEPQPKTELQPPTDKTTGSDDHLLGPGQLECPGKPLFSSLGIPNSST